MNAETLANHRFVLDPVSSRDLRTKLSRDPQEGLKQAAQQFEGLLLQMMLKSMRDAVPQDGLMNSDQTRFYTSILDQQLAQNLSTRGALGFAKMIEQQLGRKLPDSSIAASGEALDALQNVFLERQKAASSAGYLQGATRSMPLSANDKSASGSPLDSGEFVNQIWPHAVEASKSLGVPAHFLVAHSALESGWGKSAIRLPDGRPTYNLFGVKAGKHWTGSSVEVPTTEYVNGEARSTREKFRVYGSYAEAFRDYSGLLRNTPRFSEVLGQRDGMQFARALQQAGYATDPMYADKLGRIINGNTLRQSLAG